MLVYGPVPSRRLGQSIGINNIPPKICSYSCIYCQLGPTKKMQIKRQSFYDPEDICKEVEIKLNQLESENRKADYISFVPDGEPTLDINLGKTIKLLKPYGIKIAVITNSSLLWMEDVQNDLSNADWVSINVDAADEGVWRKIDRPHGKLDYKNVLEGMIAFSKMFQGTLVTETMLVENINDDETSAKLIAEQIAQIQPEKSYLLVPTRPPAESTVKRPSSENLKRTSAIIRAVSGVDLECITGDEDEEKFFITKNIEEDILSITSVHPIREDVIDILLKKGNADKSIISKLVNEGELLKTTYEGRLFFRRNIR